MVVEGAGVMVLTGVDVDLDVTVRGIVKANVVVGTVLTDDSPRLVAYIC